jgi:hypothetical protein
MSVSTFEPLRFFGVLRSRSSCFGFSTGLTEPNRRRSPSGGVLRRWRCETHPSEQRLCGRMASGKLADITAVKNSLQKQVHLPRARVRGMGMCVSVSSASARPLPPSPCNDCLAGRGGARMRCLVSCGPATQLCVAHSFRVASPPTSSRRCGARASSALRARAGGGARNAAGRRVQTTRRAPSSPAFLELRRAGTHFQKSSM